MLDQLKQAEALLRPLTAIAEDYKKSNGRRAGTILSKVKNAHLRCQEAIASIELVKSESAAIQSSDPTVLLRPSAQPAKGK